MKVIDANELILGRMATRVAKQALNGETIHIVNAEKAVITGDPKKILADYKHTRERGVPLQGPYFPRPADKIVKRTIRGMLPYKKIRGREALARVKCYIGVPEELKSQKIETIEEAHVDNTHAKFISIKEISKELGARVEDN